MLLLASYNVRAELVAIPALKTRVTDLTQTLTPDQQNQLEAKLAAFEKQKGSQIAVLMVPTTQPEDIAQYSIRVTDAWKLGRNKVNDGLLILVAKNDHKMRIEVGRGLEGAIPDLTAKRIISEIMAPSFKQDDFYGGLNNATDKLIGLVNGEQLPAPGSPALSGKSFGNLLPMLLFGGHYTWRHATRYVWQLLWRRADRRGYRPICLVPWRRLIGSDYLWHHRIFYYAYWTDWFGSNGWLWWRSADQMEEAIYSQVAVAGLVAVARQGIGDGTQIHQAIKSASFHLS